MPPDLIKQNEVESAAGAGAGGVKHPIILSFMKSHQNDLTPAYYLSTIVLLPDLNL